MTPREALAFVNHHGIVLQAARGPVPSLAEAVAGGPIKGSWWGHPAGQEIFELADAVSDDPDVLVCTLVDGKVTYVHRRLWPALVKLASRFPKARLAKTWNEHTATGAHRSGRVPFPKWVPEDVQLEAAALSIAEAETSMPFKSQAQRRKFAQLLVEGKIKPDTFEEWNRETGSAKLPERVAAPKKKAAARKKKSARKTTGGKKTARKKK